jgi:hypothetical protein
MVPTAMILLAGDDEKQHKKSKNARKNSLIKGACLGLSTLCSICLGWIRSS